MIKTSKNHARFWKYLPDNAKVLVEGVNIVTKHTKPSAQNTKGGIVKKEAPIHISNVYALGCQRPVRPSKVKRTRENGKLFVSQKNQGR